MIVGRPIIRLFSISLILTIFVGTLNLPVRANAASPQDPAKKACDWDVENIFVLSAKWGDKDRKNLDKLLDALVAVLGAASAEVKAVKTAIDKLGPAGDVVDVIVVYVCTDENGGLHRKKVQLDGLTESVEWAAKWNLLTGADKKEHEVTRDRIINKHRPTVSCCKTKPKTETPKEDSKIKGGSSSNGLFIREVPTQFGKILVNLPDDIAAGDTISGTVITEPAGGSTQERDANRDELNGYVVEVEHQKTSAGRWGKWLIPAAATAIALVVFDRRGNEVSRTNVPVENAPQSDAIIPKGNFNLPKIGQAGRSCKVTGPFRGDLEATSITMGGRPLQILAESPRQAVALTPRDLVGTTEMEVQDGNLTAKGEYRSIGTDLSAGKLALRRDEKTKLNLTLRGLAGLRAPVRIQLINRSPEIVRMKGGEDQVLTVSPGEVDRDGTFTDTRELTGESAGSFQISANLLDNQADDGLGEYPPYVEKDGRALIDAWRKAQAAKRAAEKAKAKAKKAREDADAAKAAAKATKDAADRAAKNGAPDAGDLKTDADDKKKEADAKETEAGGAETDAGTAKTAADSTQGDLDKAIKKIPPLKREELYKEAADKADAEAKEAQAEANRVKDKIAKEGDPNGDLKNYQDQQQQKADERTQDAKDLRDAANAAKAEAKP